MEPNGKMAAKFKKLLKSFGSIGKRSRGSSSTSDGHMYERLVHSDAEPDAEPSAAEPNASIRSTSLGGSIRSTSLGGSIRSTSLGGSSRNRPPAVPKGHVPVYVGLDRELFIVKIEYLGH